MLTNRFSGHMLRTRHQEIGERTPLQCRGLLQERLLLMTDAHFDALTLRSLRRQAGARTQY